MKGKNNTREVREIKNAVIFTDIDSMSKLSDATLVLQSYVMIEQLGDLVMIKLSGERPHHEAKRIKELIEK